MATLFSAADPTHIVIYRVADPAGSYPDMYLTLEKKPDLDTTLEQEKPDPTYEDTPDPDPTLENLIRI